MEAGKLIIKTVEGATEINAAESATNTIGTNGQTIFFGDGSNLTGIVSEGSLDSTLVGLSMLPAATGFLVESATDVFTQRTFSATLPISISNGTGVSGDPTISIAAASGSAAGSMSAAHYTLVNNATDQPTASTLVVRDSNGDASFGVLNATTVSSGDIASIGNLLVVGDITGQTLNGAYINGDVISGFSFLNPVIAQQNTPPGGPTVGDRYLVGTSPTGAWVGLDNQVVHYTFSTNWDTQELFDGSAVFVQATSTYLQYDGAAWSDLITTSSSIVGPLTVTQATAGNAVAIFKSTTTNDDPTETIYQNRNTTTDAIPTQLIQFSVATNESCKIKATILCRRTGGGAGAADDTGSWELYGTYKNNSGTPVLVGSIYKLEDASDTAWDVEFSTAANVINILTTGSASNNITWHVTARVYRLNT